MTATDRLADIAARLSAATPGPWELGEVTPMPDGWPGFYADAEPNIGGGLDPHDADLIAHAPTDLAALAAVVREVEALRARVATAPFESLTRDSMERSLAAALQKLGGAS